MENEKAKDLFHLREMEQIKLSRIIWEKERKNFGYLDSSSYIAETKNDDDLMVLIEKITDWSEKTKNDEIKNKVDIDLLKCIYRIHSYCFNLQTLSKQSVSMLRTSEELKSQTIASMNKEQYSLISKVRKLESELEIAKIEIEFLNKP